MDVKIKSTEVQPASLDIDSASSQAWEQRSFPIQGAGQRNVVQVVVKRSILEAIRQHGLSRTDVEVCGVLVGDCYRDERGPFIYVEAMVQGQHSESQVAQVTFTAETWTHIHEEMDKRFPNKRILGWYHTHPGFGIFLSAMDMFIHENFFNSNEQLALVYDPLSGDDGLFVWHEGKAEVYQYLVEEDSHTMSQYDSNVPSKIGATAAAHEGLEQLPDRLKQIEQRQTVLTGSLVALGLVAIFWPLLFAWFNKSDPVTHTATPPASEAEFELPDEWRTPSTPAERREREEPRTTHRRPLPEQGQPLQPRSLAPEEPPLPGAEPPPPRENPIPLDNKESNAEGTPRPQANEPGNVEDANSSASSTQPEQPPADGNRAEQAQQPPAEGEPPAISESEASEPSNRGTPPVEETSEAATSDPQAENSTADSPEGSPTSENPPATPESTELPVESETGETSPPVEEPAGDDSSEAQ